MAVFLEKRKNDQFREGSWILSPPHILGIAPLSCFKGFFPKEIIPTIHFYFEVSHTKNGVKLGKEKLSYTRALELVRKHLRAISLDPQQYGLHSLRSGGACLAAAMGIPDKLIMRHGGWK